MGAKVKSLNRRINREKEGNDSEKSKDSDSHSEAKEHVEQLQRLQAKDQEFYEFLKEHDKELLQFDDEDFDEDVDDDVEDTDIDHDNEDPEISEHDFSDDEVKKPQVGEKQQEKIITTAMVDSWCISIQESGKLAPVRSILKAFRTACHYGDENEGDTSTKFSVMSSSVFNKVMLFVLSNMDGILRKLLKLPNSGGKKETILNLMNTKAWKNYNHLVKSYLGNAFHVLNQMTDTEMVAFTLRRLKYSSVFLAAFPRLLRKFMKTALHFWGTGGGALPVVSFLFLRDLCVRVGSDCLDECFKGIYKAYVSNCRFITPSKLQHIQFLQNCVIELLQIDLPTAYQHGFVFIRQLAMILRETLNTRTKEAFLKVYEWKFINCLELWTGAVCSYASDPNFRPLAYPLTQIVFGVARLVPTARYFPLRLRCVRMLNRIAASTDTFIPVSMLLLDMLEMKELSRAPTGGTGNAVDLRTILKVSEATLKTRAFQEACVFSVVEELGEHLTQWSYSIAFSELSFIPVVRLRSFCRSTKVERFQKDLKQLIRQIEANTQFTNAKRMSISFLPNDLVASSFLETEKRLGASPLSQHLLTLRQRGQRRNNLWMESNVVVGEHSSVFGKNIPESDEEDEDTRRKTGMTVFSSSWLPGTDSKSKDDKKIEKKQKKKKRKRQEGSAMDEDVVEDLVLSSDEEGSLSDEFPEIGAAPEVELKRKQTQKPRSSPGQSKKPNSRGKNSKKRKMSK